MSADTFILVLEQPEEVCCAFCQRILGAGPVIILLNGGDSLWSFCFISVIRQKHPHNATGHFAIDTSKCTESWRLGMSDSIPYWMPWFAYATGTG